MTERTWKCRAERWNGHPIIEGPHSGHLFHYGPHDMYTGSCAGYEDDDDE